MPDQGAQTTRQIEYGNAFHVLTPLRSFRINQSIVAVHYSIADDRFHEVTIFSVAKGVKTPEVLGEPGHRSTIGFISGKGTLFVGLTSGSNETYYFEQQGLNKEIGIKPGETYHWTAPNDSTLEYFVLSAKLPAIRPQPLSPPPQVASTVRSVGKLEGSVKRLFLVSTKISGSQNDALIALTGKQPAATSFLIIENAADVEKTTPSWVIENREMLEQLGYHPEQLDLRRYLHLPIDLLQKLQQQDIVWLGGGNTFYLRWLLRATRADEMLSTLVAKNKIVYSGASAGAIVAGPTLKYFEAADNPADAPEVIRDGMHMTEYITVPHMNDPRFGSVVAGINDKLLRDGYKTVPLSDDQVLVITGKEHRVI